ncbi:imidazole glycerol phosphate synthase subunit HisH [Massilia sp. AB1]|uniref:imidazole glycerol phosphate synthase subunit HisH n=1 Tax=Massilia sp. AB1 TaxID=2823371 RepID=UPI001B8362A1|nr:imidazole glycerol phosphate synthase subunit HisH [Massilia sp. AB1]MBQ5939638.1 imidazole glycerol phosphate synthase subunit HisH [Massilia sp. AB1]
MISVIDYGAGNVGSVIRMIEKVGGKAQRVSTARELDAAQIAILPGVGAFDYGMAQLAEKGLVEALNEAALVRRIPILGICLGMQLMCKRSDEGVMPGLGWIDAEVKKFEFDQATRLPIPHMGWNTLELKRENGLLDNELERTRYYFVHSYRVSCSNPEDVIATTEYGGSFVSAFAKDNLFGAQFHPEKSHRFGMAMIKNFLEWDHAE